MKILAVAVSATEVQEVIFNDCRLGHEPYSANTTFCFSVWVHGAAREFLEYASASCLSRVPMPRYVLCQRPARKFSRPCELLRWK